MRDETTPGPSFAAMAALLGDPARAVMLTALMDGRARTAGELAAVAAVSASTASAHLARLAAAGVIAVVRQGRHRYHRIASAEVAGLIESLMQLPSAPVTRAAAFGPRERALREARVCYDHLAGTLGVALADGLLRGGYLAGSGDYCRPTPSGAAWLATLGIDAATLLGTRRPTCRFCMDWSERRLHLAGALGAALLEAMLEHGMLARSRGSRALVVRDPARRLIATLHASAAVAEPGADPCQ